jgi:hypothetical protein
MREKQGSQNLFIFFFPAPFFSPLPANIVLTGKTIPQNQGGIQ